MSAAKTAVLATSMILAAACSRGGAGADTEAHAEADSTRVDIDVPEAIEHLPDTVYPSAATVKYQVDVYGKDLDPRIDDLADLYAHTPGAFTFRKGIHRQGDFGGRVKGTPAGFTIDWSATTESEGTWGGGTGWTGQPLYIEWPDSSLARLRGGGLVKEGFSGREIMVGSLCGNVYFLDYETGEQSREPICVTNPIKGTMSIDPTLNGNLYVGQGVPEEKPFGALVIDLYKNAITDMFAEDPKARRGWGAYDSSPVRMGQYLFRPGENGTLYKLLALPGKPRLQSTLRYTVGWAAPGIESSMAIYLNYGYVADNHGNIICVNLDTMKPVWRHSLGDDIDSSIVLIEEGGTPYIYTGCEIDRNKDEDLNGTARYVKLNGLDGTQAWEVKVEGRQYLAPDGKHFDGGFYSTALPGTGNCDSLLFINCVLNESTQNGRLMAINRHTGRTAYTIDMNRYAWSSPVGFTNERGEMYVVTGDCAGYLYLIDGKDGRVIASQQVGSNFESSPVAVGSSLVVGSRGYKIYKISIK